MIYLYFVIVIVSFIKTLNIHMNHSISQTTQYTPNEIMKEILLKMDYKGYEITSHNDRILDFNGRAGNISRKSILWYIRFYEGEFKIIDDESKRVVRLQYEVYSTIDLVLFPIILAFFLTISIMNKSNYGCAVAGLLLATFVLKFFTLYFTAKNILKDILF